VKIGAVKSHTLTGGDEFLSILATCIFRYGSVCNAAEH